MRRFPVVLASLVTGLVTFTAPATAAPEQPELPVVYNALAAISHATLNPGAAPPGANDWSCEPSEEHPNPVVLVHGTLANMTVNWHTLAPLLKNNGYCVFALNFGQEQGALRVGFPGAYPPGGTGPVEGSAAELDAFVDRVLEETDAEEVDIVGHSQGGMMPRHYLKNLGGADEVGKLIGLSPSNHGTTVLGLATLPGAADLLGLTLGDALRQQIRGSEFLTGLNEGGDTVPGVEYTVIQGRYDEVVTPYTSSYLDGPDVDNIVLQDDCGLDLSDHLAVAFSSRALRYVLNALDPEDAVTPPCRPVLPGVGG
ncbi:lipase [Amycolatopsis antarctica]|uniref:Lipase n=1 Tax=Amycolatopsis antarctica TaxID=1854586 RepID=A0A263DBB7_9PSEU|nr:alpha/beta fold hydrolase [Amycolatopsis antarctica]OZM74807.1 lipase [Amycolatopsis antarctica]